MIELSEIKTQSTWTFTTILSAVDAHEKGDFKASALLADHYGRDERISGCTLDRISVLTGEDSAPFEFETSDVDVAASASVIVDLEAFWHDMMTDAWLHVSLHDLIHMGLSISHVEWEMNESEWRPIKLTRMHLSNVKWDDKLKAYILSAAGGEKIEIRDGDPNWLIVAPGGPRSWMMGAVRSLGVFYFMRGLNYTDFARYCERHGTPILKIYEPESQNTDQKDNFYRDLTTMGAKGVIRLPRTDGEEFGYDVEPMEMKSKTYGAFKDFNEVLQTSISIRILGQNLSTEIQGGSFAAAGWHARVKQSIVRGDASAMGAALWSVVKWYAEKNQPDFDPKAAPWPRWRLVIPEDLHALATVIQTSAQGLISLLTAGVEVDLVAFAKKFGVPLLEGAKPEGTGFKPATSTPPSTTKEPTE